VGVVNATLHRLWVNNFDIGVTIDHHVGIAVIKALSRMAGSGSGLLNGRREGKSAKATRIKEARRTHRKLHLQELLGGLDLVELVIEHEGAGEGHHVTNRAPEGHAGPTPAQSAARGSLVVAVNWLLGPLVTASGILFFFQEKKK